MYGEAAKPYTDAKNWSNDYLSPPELVWSLGTFDLDPACPSNMPWETATTMLSEKGLTTEWTGRVWMNPPYRGVLPWVEKFVANNRGICLLNGRSTETRATQLAMKNASAILFPAKRLTFFKPTGEAWAQKWFPSVLVGLSVMDAAALLSISAHEKFGGAFFSRR